MSIKNIFRVPHQSTPASVALLFLRLFMGAAFLYHEYGKMLAPFHWIPAEASIHIPPFFQFLAAISEFCGGIALILGVIVPLASFGMASTMLVASFTHAMIYKDPFVNLNGGSSFESPMSYLFISIVFFAVGPGKYSLDKLIFGEK
ncbi:MAG: DoxX family protein [Rhizobacter sp.]|nr:DoxX family protein [Bacteriovorax sp.]